MSGHVPKGRRRQVYERDGHRCTFVNSDGDRCVIENVGGPFGLTIEHIVPRSAGGTNDMENLTTHCWYHNQETNRAYQKTWKDQPPARRQRPSKIRSFDVVPGAKALEERRHWPWRISSSPGRPGLP